MCKDYIEIKSGKLLKVMGKYKKGHWVFCSICGALKIEENGFVVTIPNKRKKL